MFIFVLFVSAGVAADLFVVAPVVVIVAVAAVVFPVIVAVGKNVQV